MPALEDAIAWFEDSWETVGVDHEVITRMQLLVNAARAHLTDSLDARRIPRQPTVAMLQVDVRNGASGGMCSGCLMGAVWRAMYDAALAEPQEAKT